jgi:hypothetical protein
LCCDEDGVALGPVRLVEKSDEVPGKRYKVCSAETFVGALAVAYGRLPDDWMLYLANGIGRMTKSLEEGDLTLAMMKATFLRFPEIEPENMAKLEAEELVKAGFNPNEWRNETGQWCRNGAQGVKRPRLLHKQRAFFDKMYAPIHQISQKYDFNEDSLLALSAHESGWLNDHNSTLNNPFGVTFAGGNNQPYPSIEAAAKYWGDRYGDVVRGLKTIDDFCVICATIPKGIIIQQVKIMIIK